MKRWALALLLAASAAAQFTTVPPGGSGGVGVGAANVVGTCTGTVTACAVPVTTLALTSSTLNTALIQCFNSSGTPITITGVASTGTAPVTVITPSFASTSAPYCTVNSNGGAGAQGIQGPAGIPIFGNVVSYSANQTAGAVNCQQTMTSSNSSGITITLPASITAPCDIYVIASATGGTITIALSGGATLNGVTTPLPTFACATGVCAGQVFQETQAGNWVSAAGPVGPQGIQGPAGAGTFNPLDPTQFLMTHSALSTGFNGGFDGWSFSGCNGSTSPSGFPNNSAESIVPPVFGAGTGSANLCGFFWPTNGNSTGSGQLWDYFSGSTPAQLYLTATHVAFTTTATQYVGLAGAYNSVGYFVGCVQATTGNWKATIISNGTVLSSVDTGIARTSATPQRIQVDNNSGTANTVRCSVNGGTTAGSGMATATGTIPSPPGPGWIVFQGVQSAGSATDTFGQFSVVFFLKGLPRL